MCGEGVVDSEAGIEERRTYTLVYQLFQWRVSVIKRINFLYRGYEYNILGCHNLHVATGSMCHIAIMIYSVSASTLPVQATPTLPNHSMEGIVLSTALLQYALPTSFVSRSQI